MTKAIAVLLTVHNRRDKTLNCLYNLFLQEVPEGCEIQVYLTDDGCTDGTPETVEKCFPQVNIIKGNGKLFWNRGMWTAWIAAVKDRKYDYYLWLNDDTYTYPMMLTSLVEISKDKDNKAIIVGPTVDTKGRGIHTYGGRRGCQLVPLNGMLQRCDTFNGNIVLIPKYVYEQLGCNEPYFHHSLGDLDYGMRAHKVGIEIYQLGRAVGECDRHGHIMKWCNPDLTFKNRWKALYHPTGYPPKEVFYFNKKHYGTVKAIVHVVTIFLRCLMPKLWIKMNKANWI